MVARTLAPAGRQGHGDVGAAWAVLLVVIVLAGAVWGAWKLGVMAGERADWRQGLPHLSGALRQTPSPQPPPLPTQRRPAVTPDLRD